MAGVWSQHPITIKNISFDTVLSVTLPREALDQDQDQVHSTQTSEEEEMGASIGYWGYQDSCPKE